MEEARSVQSRGRPSPTSYEYEVLSKLTRDMDCNDLDEAETLWLSCSKTVPHATGVKWTCGCVCLRSTTRACPYHAERLHALKIAERIFAACLSRRARSIGVHGKSVRTLKSDGDDAPSAVADALGCEELW